MPSTSFNPVLKDAIVSLVNNCEEFEGYRDNILAAEFTLECERIVLLIVRVYMHPMTLYNSNVFACTEPSLLDSITYIIMVVSINK